MFCYEIYVVEYRSKKELQINALCFYFCFTQCPNCWIRADVKTFCNLSGLLVCLFLVIRDIVIYVTDLDL